MNNLKPLSEDKRLRLNVSIEKSNNIKFFKYLESISGCRIYSEEGRYETSKYVYNFYKKQIHSIMECVASSEMSLWIRTNFGYLMYPHSNLSWIQASEKDREASKIVHDLWSSINTNPELKAKLRQPDNSQKYTEPFPIKDLPSDIQNSLFLLGNLQSQMDAEYNPINPEKFSSYSIKLATSQQNNNLKSYSWDFFETNGNSRQTISNASVTNIYESQKELDDFIQKHKNNTYKTTIKPIIKSKRKSLYTKYQISLCQIKINHFEKGIKISELAVRIFKNNNLNFFVRDPEDPILADVILNGCFLEDFLDNAFTNAWSLSPEGVFIIGQPYPGPEPVPTLNCQIKYYDLPQEPISNLPTHLGKHLGGR